MGKHHLDVYIGYSGLLAAVIRLAVLDARNGDVAWANDAREFLSSSGLEAIVIIAGVDVADWRRAVTAVFDIESGSKLG